MTQNNVKRKVRFSVIDFAIIIMIISLLVGVILRYDIAKRLFSKTSLSEAKVTFIAEKITPEQAEAFSEGAKFYINNDSFGTLSGVNKEKALLSKDINGTLVFYEDASLIDIKGTFKIKVLRSENGYLHAGNRYIAPGSAFNVMANGVSVRIEILSITDID